MTEAYPLQWPDGWPRHKGPRESDRRFRGGTYGLHWDRVYRQLVGELKRLGAPAASIVVSTSMLVRLDGMPYAQQRRIDDPGVAVYFMLKKRPMVMAQDRYETVVGNMRSLGVAIEAMRAVERHGGGHMMERAFQGFLAITPPSWKKPWREVLCWGDPVDPSAESLSARYRTLAKGRHPDNGGNDTLMAELNVAYAEAKQELGIE